MVFENDVVLFVPLLCFPSWETSLVDDLETRFTAADPLEEISFRVSVAEHPLQDDLGQELWFSVLKERLANNRKRALRKQCSTVVVDALRQIACSRVHVVVGHGQGPLVVWFALHPGMRGWCYKSRCVVPQQAEAPEAAFRAVSCIHLMAPTMHPRNDQLGELLDQFSEFYGTGLTF